MARKRSWGDVILTPWRYQWVADPDSPRIGRQSQEGRPIRSGTATITVVDIMAAYDELPRPGREAVANATHAWAPHGAKMALSYTSAVLDDTPADIVARIQAADRREAIGRELQLLAGKG